MEKIIIKLAIILPIIALITTVLFLCFNLYLKIRRKLSVKVNCWFCNQWTKVPYDERDCFECPTCLQYNGFDSDGGYNKLIPAQHDEMLNQPLPISNNASNYTSSNGLCHICNNNQQLRVYQLANFIPLNDANFDVEIEHFKKQLDKAYKLCSKCEVVVKKTIRKQNQLLGLKFSRLCKKGIELLDLNSSHNGISKRTKWLFLKNLIHLTVIAFAFLNLMLALMKVDFSDGNLRKTVPKWSLVYVLWTKNICIDFFNNLNNFNFKIWENINGIHQWLINIVLKLPLASKAFSYVHSVQHRIEIKSDFLPTLPRTSLDDVTLLCLVGALFQFMLMLWSDISNFKKKLLPFCAWLSLIYINWNYPNNKSNILNAAEIAASSVIISLMCFMRDSKIRTLKKRKHVFEKLKSKSKLNHSLDEFSDNEEIETCTSVHNSTFKSQSNFHVNTANSTYSLNDTKIGPDLGNYRHNVKSTGILENCLTRKPCDTTSSAATIKGSLNQSFISAKSCLSDRTSLANTASSFNDLLFVNNKLKSTNEDLDLYASLNKLNLGNPSVKKTNNTNAFCFDNNLSRPKPVISPARLRNVTQNSWVAGGFWRDSNGVLLPINSCSNLSSSSSQTSGFVSQLGPFERNRFNSLPSSVNNSIYGDLECNTVFSEPVFNVNGASTMQNRNFNHCCNGLYQNDLRHYSGAYHPVHHEQLVYVTPNCFYNGMYNVCFNNNLPRGSTFLNNSFSRDTQSKKF